MRTASRAASSIVGLLMSLDAGIPASKLTSQPTMLDAARAAVAISNGSK